MTVTSSTPGGGGTAIADSASADVEVTGSGLTPDQMTVSVNGVMLYYDASRTAFRGKFALSMGSDVTVAVRVGRTTYTQTITSFDRFPLITEPLQGTLWSPYQNNWVRWTNAAALAPVHQAAAILKPNGYDYPDGGLAWVGQNALPVSGNELTPGERAALVGIVNRVSNWPGAQSGSSLEFTAFSLVPIAVATDAQAVDSLRFVPDAVAVEPGGSTALRVEATYKDGHTAEVTSQVTSWSSTDTSRATVSGGSVAGIARGQATLRATLMGKSAETKAVVFKPTPSPVAPLAASRTYQGDPAHSGFLTFGGAPLSFPPTASWSRTFTYGVSYPIVADGRVFVTVSQTQLYALDLATGATVWGPIEITGSFSGMPGPAYDAGKVFVVNGAGQARAYDAATGALLWSKSIGYAVNVSSSLTAKDGVLYVGLSGFVQAMDQLDGETIWWSQVNGGGYSTPTVAGDGMYLSYQCEIYKFHALSGAKLWSRNAGCSSSLGRTAALGPDGLFVRNTYQLPAPPPNTITENIYDPVTGTRHAGFLSSTIPAVPPSGVGYFIHDGQLKAANPRSFGSPSWVFTGDSPLTLPPLLIDSTAFVAAASGKVYAVDVATGLEVWQTSVSPASTALNEDSAVTLTGFGAGEGWVLMSSAGTVHAWKLR